MGYYFPAILLSLTLFCGVAYVFCRLIKSDNALNHFWPFTILDWVKDFFWVLLVVLVLRSFVGSLYTVPTGSLEPTVMPGDILFVTKYAYGLRTPVWEHIILTTGKPKRGDIVVFHNPVHPKTNLIKRVIGLPGDHINYVNHVLYINGVKIQQTYLGKAIDIVEKKKISVQKFEEDLDGVKHAIFVNPNTPMQNFYNVVVPKNSYFMMGDNRSYSDDSRYWGFASNKLIIGQAKMVVINFSHLKRIGDRV